MAGHQRMSYYSNLHLEMFSTCIVGQYIDPVFPNSFDQPEKQHVHAKV